MSIELIQGSSKAPTHLRIGVVTARFNSEITEQLEAGALKALREAGVAETSIQRVRVPGAVEIPMATKWLIENGCAGVVTLGAVIKGETFHFESVCNSVERALTHLQLDLNAPIAFGVLTTYTEEQARERIGGAHGHKGVEAAQVLIEMLNLKQKLQSIPHKQGAPQ